MKVELCDLCHNRVGEFDKTEVIIKDYKGITFECWGAAPAKRKFKGVICDDCLERLRDGSKNKE